MYEAIVERVVYDFLIEMWSGATPYLISPNGQYYF